MILLQGKSHDLGGGMVVRRLLPQIAKRSVGPFVFLDHMGPVQVMPGQNTDVRPHPHIGLSTMTYLFSGHMVHRDSLGYVADIQPGEVNWMTAGRGISHSERARESDRQQKHEMHGLQFWVALPDDQEDCEPSFQHYDSKVIPKHTSEARELTLIAGEAFGLKSPVRTTSPLVFAEFKARQDFALNLTEINLEIAVYIITGEAKMGDQNLNSMQMLVLERNNNLLEVKAGSHFVIFGGEPLATPRHIWWNLVSSSKEKIETAKLQWKSGTFPMVPGETEFIPLPDA